MRKPNMLGSGGILDANDAAAIDTGQATNGISTSNTAKRAAQIDDGTAAKQIR
jgi:hypothetical protein